MFELSLIILIFTLLYLIYTITKNDEQSYIDKIYHIYENNLIETNEKIKKNKKTINSLKKEIEKYENKKSY